MNWMQLVLGNGALKMSGNDMGILDKGSQFIFGYELKEIVARASTTDPILELKGVIPVRHYALFRAKPQEITAENTALNLGGLPIQVIGTEKRLNLGAAAPSFSGVKLEFSQYTPSPINKTIYICLWKVVPRGLIDPTFGDEFSSFDSEYLALADRTAHPDNPFGYISFL